MIKQEAAVFGCLCLLPGHLELPPVVGTVLQVKINQGLIGDALSISQELEVVDGAAIDIDGDQILQSAFISYFKN